MIFESTAKSGLIIGFDDRDFPDISEDRMLVNRIIEDVPILNLTGNIIISFRLLSLKLSVFMQITGKESLL